MTADGRPPVVMFAVGDMMLGDAPSSFGSGVGSVIEKRGPHFPFDYCRSVLNEGDIVCGNLEAVLSRPAPGDDFEAQIYRGHPHAAAGLAAAGFNVLSLANNHIMQHGRQAVLETVNHLKAHGIGIIGIAGTGVPAGRPLVVERKGLSVALLAYNLRPNQYPGEEPFYASIGWSEMLDEIKEASRMAQRTVVSLHWGDEFVKYPSPQQVLRAREMIDAGATLVLGHHPHIVQGIERYRRGAIAYSLGNFIFDMRQRRLRQSMIMKCIFTDADVVVQVIPVQINTQWQPVPLVGSAAKRRAGEIGRLGREVRVDRDGRAYARRVLCETARFRFETYLAYVLQLRHYSGRQFLGNVRRILRNRFGAVLAGRRRPS